MLFIINVQGSDSQNNSEKSFDINDNIKRNVNLEKSNDNCSLDCGLNGFCRINENNQVCVCDKNWIDHKGETCSYEQRSKLVAFLLSFLVGGLGVDWFYLARGNVGYIVAGVFKLLTGGGLGIWWLCDWIRILCDAFNDGNDVKLYQDF